MNRLENPQTFFLKSANDDERGYSLSSEMNSL